MTENSYEGMLDQVTERLMIQRARHFGFQGEELDDVLQDLAIKLQSFAYDATRTESLSEQSMLAVWLDNHLKNHLRTSKRRRMRNERQAKENARHTTDYVTQESITQEAEFNLFAATLTPFDRKVFNWLRKGKELTFIAGKLKCRWHTVKCAAHRLAASLIKKGLVPSDYCDNP